MELHTYQEVVRVPNFNRKCIVLLGAHGVGRRHIKSTLIDQYSQNFAYPIPHTSRPPRPEEVPGQHFNFLPHEQMQMEINQNKYLEFGSHDGHLYGTRMNSIREIIASGKMPVLDIEPSSLKMLTNGPEFAPLIIFVAAPLQLNPQLHAEYTAITDEHTLYRLQEQSDELYRKYRHVFDKIIINDNPTDSFNQVLDLIRNSTDSAQWVPHSWVY